MKKILLATLILTFAASPGLAEKIGVINLEKVMTSSEPAEEAMSELQGKYQAVKEKLDTKKEEIETLREEMEKQKMVLSQEAQEDKEAELKKKIQEIRKEARGYEQRIQNEQRQLSEPILELLQEIVSDYGEKKDYTLIIDSQNSGLLYAKDSLDITDVVIDELDKAWRAQREDED
ncbi:MAG: OmpH family outer membrane protein [Desulfonatronovibrionaceae bacterium]